MEIGEVAQYIEERFPRILAAYARGAKKNPCSHHGVPVARAVWVTPQKELHRRPEYRDERFWLAWYTLTIVDQFLYAEFPARYERWVRACGGCPVPMRSAGDGCLRIYRATLFPANVRRVVGVEFNPATVGGFHRYFTETIVPAIERDAGVWALEFLAVCPVKELFNYYSMFHQPEV